MAKNSGIQWTDHTFNPWRGCVKVSAGCKNCYAENSTPVRVARSRGLETWGADAARVQASEAMWREPLAWNREAEAAGDRRRVFCASLADVFEDRPDLDAPRARLFALIEATPALDWLLLTKRPENMRRLASVAWPKRWPSNVWAGCTVEDQAMATERIPHLLEVPAAVRFLSMEPLLGPVDLMRVPLNGTGAALWCPWCNQLDEPAWIDSEAWCSNEDCEAGPIPTTPDWIIIGGESGSKARPFNPDWARSLVLQAREAEAAPFVKQLGARPVLTRYDLSTERFTDLDAAGWDEHHGPPTLHDSHGGDMAEWAADLQVREFPARAVST